MERTPVTGASLSVQIDLLGEVKNKTYFAQ